MRTLAEWNLDFTAKRRENMKRKLHQSSRFEPKGKGNKAWKRAEALLDQPGTIVWPTYCLL